MMRLRRRKIMFNDLPHRRPWLRALWQAVGVIGVGLTVWLTGCAQTRQPSAGDNSIVPPTASAPTAVAQIPPASDADRLTDLLVRTLPMGMMIEIDLNRDPNWPFDEKVVARVDPESFQCLRQRLSISGFRKNREAAVKVFVERYPDQVQDAIDVLEQGAADFLGSIILATAKIMPTDKPITPETVNDIVPDMYKKIAPDIYKNTTPKQLTAVADLRYNDRYKSLRELLLFGADQFPTEQNGINLAQMINNKLVLEAVDHCHIPISAFLP
jgi:hypothetical protein